MISRLWFSRKLMLNSLCVSILEDASCMVGWCIERAFIVLLFSCGRYSAYLNLLILMVTPACSVGLSILVPSPSVNFTGAMGEKEQRSDGVMAKF